MFCFLGGEPCVYARGAFFMIAVDSLYINISRLKIDVVETVTSFAGFATPYEVGFSLAPRYLRFFLAFSALRSGKWTRCVRTWRLTLIQFG